MFPDLGKHLIPVLSAYGAMIVLIGGVIILSLNGAKKSKETLAELEKKRNTNV